MNKAGSHVSFQPLTIGAKRAEGHRADDIADCSHHVPLAVFFQLLRGWALLMHVVSLAVSKCLVHLLHIARINDIQLVVFNAQFMQAVFQRGNRLKQVIHQDLAANELTPAEMFIGLAGSDKEPIPFIDLCEMQDVALSSGFQGGEAGGNCGLCHVAAACLKGV